MASFAQSLNRTRAPFGSARRTQSVAQRPVVHTLAQRNDAVSAEVASGDSWTHIGCRSFEPVALRTCVQEASTSNWFSQAALSVATASLIGMSTLGLQVRC